MSSAASDEGPWYSPSNLGSYIRTKNTLDEDDEEREKRAPVLGRASVVGELEILRF